MQSGTHVIHTHTVIRPGGMHDAFTAKHSRE